MKNSDYIYFLNQRKKWYDSIKEIYCEVLGVSVRFNSKGFYHIKYNGLGHRRNQGDVLRRLVLLTRVGPILQKVRSVSEYRSDGFKEYWTFKKDGIVVVVRRLGGGSIHFYSVWKGK